MSSVAADTRPGGVLGYIPAGLSRGCGELPTDLWSYKSHPGVDVDRTDAASLPDDGDIGSGALGRGGSDLSRMKSGVAFGLVVVLVATAALEEDRFCAEQPATRPTTATARRRIVENDT